MNDYKLMKATPSLTFIEAIKKCFANYANFKGRARRSEFWWWYLFTCVVNFILYIPIWILMSKKNALSGNIDLATANAQDPTTMIIIFYIILGIVYLALLLPSLSVMVRRFHDVGKSGNLMWLFLLFGIGVPVCLILCIPDGDRVPNKYGSSPKFTEFTV